MIELDVNTFIGGYPFRAVPHPEPEILARVLAREGIAAAWVGHLPSAWYRDPSPGNDELFTLLEPHQATLVPIPVVRPDWPRWEKVLESAVARGCPAVRAYPAQWGMAGDSESMRRLAAACGEARIALQLTVRFEDLRQRHWMDSAPDLPGSALRALARVSESTRIIVCAASRALLEEVHWGLTPEERVRILWDISWLWGPPEDHLAHLLRTVGAERLVFGSMWPLRLVQTPIANIELLPDDLRAARLGSLRAAARRGKETGGRGPSE
jgi:hypothetical protein